MKKQSFKKALTDMLLRKEKEWCDEDAVLMKAFREDCDMDFVVDFLYEDRGLSEDIEYTVGLNGHFSGRHSGYLIWKKRDKPKGTPWMWQPGYPFPDYHSYEEHAVERYFANMVHITH